MSEGTPTGDPLIAQHEEAALDAARARRAANLFDLRRMIGGLFLIYGVILVILGLGESDESIAKSADMNVNLWSGVGMLVLSVLFLVWAFGRPLGEEPGGGGQGDEDRGTATGTGAP
jgi:hypothetical protein